MTDAYPMARLRLKELQMIRIAVSFAVDRTPSVDSVFKQEWQAILPKLDAEIENIERFERAQRASRPRSG